jgi:pyruvate dehydrogenase E1 component alpha subunit
MATTGSAKKGAPARRDAADAPALLEQMLLIRRFEEKAAEMYALGKIGGFLHLYIGQEAVAVGAISALRPDDYVIAGYREHGHALAKGADPRRVMAELFGRRDGVSKGKGGSMHMFDRRSTSWAGTRSWAATCPSPPASGSPSATRSGTG